MIQMTAFYPQCGLDSVNHDFPVAVAFTLLPGTMHNDEHNGKSRFAVGGVSVLFHLLRETVGPQYAYGGIRRRGA